MRSISLRALLRGGWDGDFIAEECGDIPYKAVNYTRFAVRYMFGVTLPVGVRGSEADTLSKFATLEFLLVIRW